MNDLDLNNHHYETYSIVIMPTVDQFLLQVCQKQYADNENAKDFISRKIALCKKSVILFRP